MILNSVLADKNTSITATHYFHGTWTSWTVLSMNVIFNRHSFSDTVSTVAWLTFSGHIFRFDIMCAGLCNKNLWQNPQNILDGNIKIQSCWSIIFIFYSKPVHSKKCWDQLFCNFIELFFLLFLTHVLCVTRLLGQFYRQYKRWTPHTSTLLL